jgi:hypothetical protein
VQRRLGGGLRDVACGSSFEMMLRDPAQEFLDERRACAVGSPGEVVLERLRHR